ncbi:DUF1542 domain-containing protein [Staphylococcus hominis]|uniref:DUF1542 domain-containing protein n=1 Tax=Staphylococcus hominis TaxID=1290 RepID=UPI0011A39E1C
MEEKEGGKEKVEEEVRKGKDSIDEGIRNSDVDEGKDRGSVGINKIEGEVVKKERGKNAIDEIGLSRKGMIDERGDGRREEKEGGK